MKRIHYFTGLLLILFITLHLVNHLFSIWGAEKHIEIMNLFRIFYRNNIVEPILLMTVFVQIISGTKLFFTQRKIASTFFDKLQLWSGLYLAIFFSIHVGAVLFGRHILQVDTNFYFGVAGLNTFPINLFFIPYYGLAIFSFFGHLSAIHFKKMQAQVFDLEPRKQSYVIIIIGILLAILTLFGLTNGFQGVEIPKEYYILIGK